MSSNPETKKEQAPKKTEEKKSEDKSKNNDRRRSRRERQSGRRGNNKGEGKKTAKKENDDDDDSQENVKNNNGGINDYTAKTCGKHVTIYGWSSTEEGSDKWKQADGLGEALAKKGYGVVTGGYGGSMAAVSKGAAEATPAEGTQMTRGAQPRRTELLNAKTRKIAAAGKVAVRGVLVPNLFPDRHAEGNAHLNEHIDTAGLVPRLKLLTKLTRYYIALPGTLGTLTELALIWNLASVQQAVKPEATADEKGTVPVIIAFRAPWESLLKSVGESLGIPEEHMKLIKFVDSVDEVVTQIDADWNSSETRKAAEDNDREFNAEAFDAFIAPVADETKVDDLKAYLEKETGKTIAELKIDRTERDAASKRRGKNGDTSDKPPKQFAVVRFADITTHDQSKEVVAHVHEKVGNKKADWSMDQAVTVTVVKAKNLRR